MEKVGTSNGIRKEIHLSLAMPKNFDGFWAFKMKTVTFKH